MIFSNSEVWILTQLYSNPWLSTLSILHLSTRSALNLWNVIISCEILWAWITESGWCLWPHKIHFYFVTFCFSVNISNRRARFLFTSVIIYIKAGSRSVTQLPNKILTIKYCFDDTLRVFPFSDWLHPKLRNLRNKQLSVSKKNTQRRFCTKKERCDSEPTKCNRIQKSYNICSSYCIVSSNWVYYLLLNDSVHIKWIPW